MSDEEPQRDLPEVQKASKMAPATTPSESAAPQKTTLSSLRAAAEIHAISNALAQTGWNRRRAAEILSISYRGLLYKIRRHNITPPADRRFTPLVQR